MWTELAINATLLAATVVFIMEISMSEELVVFILTGIHALIL
jgi:hypothetical protein